ncbi:MAG: MBL fold metallo-hydrolase [Oscillibacter sp.]|nr:MBL fold metallo-hydrolase [Oscillibacter sp.]MEA4994792.1 MBL fold metallo-hydrolase [Oscillibacter sp.]
MTVTWQGHACFLLEQDGYRIVVDPYTGVPGYPALELEAHGVYCSHGHFDHSYTDGVTLLPGRESPFSVKEVPSFHDGEEGALRGENTIRVCSAGDVRVCHLGDLGHLLSEKQAEAIGRCDVLLVPVGGTLTVDAAGAKAVCDALRPRTVVPMHYRHAPFGLEKVSGVEDFLALWPQGAVQRLPGSSFTYLAKGGGETTAPVVLVPRYPA